MAKRKSYMMSTLRVAIPAPPTLPALGELAREYDAALASFSQWVAERGGTIEAEAPVSRMREISPAAPAAPGDDATGQPGGGE